MTKYKGECFCGSVQVEVTGEPAVMNQKTLKFQKAKSFLAVLPKFKVTTVSGVINVVVMFMWTIALLMGK